MRAHQTRVALLVGVGILVSLCAPGVVAKLGARKPEEMERRKLQTRLTIIGTDGNPPPEAFPLQECTGDCDTDDECDTGLICFQRDARVEVPGCEGGRQDNSRTDFCVVDPNGPAPPTTDAPTQPPPAPTGQPTSNPTGAPTSQPTLAPTGSPSSMPSYSTFGNIEYVGNEGTFYSTYPMGACKGDCDMDDDCQEGLYCHQRNSFGAVPYCDGGETEPSTADFCAWDGTGAAPDMPVPPPEGYFRLKLYWEEGYHWQNETFEREWCMMYDYDGYPGTGLCWYGDENQKCEQDKLYVAKCIDEPRMWFTFVNVTSNISTTGVHEYLIMTGDDQRCFQRKDRTINLQNCNPDNPLQRFFALNGDFFGEQFEISQLGYTSQCVTNDHHPKSGEVIETHHCEDSRSNESQTSYWERY